MAHGLGLGEARQIELAFAAQAAETVFGDLDIGQIDAGMIAVANFKEQGFGGQERRRSRDHGLFGGRGGGTALGVHAHAISPSSPATSAAISASVVSSVAARTRRFSTSGRPGSSRETGRPARMPFCARASTTGAAGTGRRTVISLKKDV